MKNCALPSYSDQAVVNLHPDSLSLAAPVPCLAMREGTERNGEEREEGIKDPQINWFGKKREGNLGIYCDSRRRSRKRRQNRIGVKPKARVLGRRKGVV